MRLPVVLKRRQWPVVMHADVPWSHCGICNRLARRLVIVCRIDVNNYDVARGRNLRTHLTSRPAVALLSPIEHQLQLY